MEGRGTPGQPVTEPAFAKTTKLTIENKQPRTHRSRASEGACRRNGGTPAGTRRKQQARPVREGGPDGQGSSPDQGVIRHCWM
jgi:hypothetical protein